MCRRGEGPAIAQIGPSSFPEQSDHSYLHANEPLNSMRTPKLSGAVVAMLCLAGAGSALARPQTVTKVYDGTWHLSFLTRAGECDPSYEFDVNISNGVITHPNLVRFHGMVRKGGAVRASVTVHDKYASGSGRLSQSSGSGSWSGYSAGARCSGAWTAQRY